MFNRKGLISSGKKEDGPYLTIIDKCDDAYMFAWAPYYYILFNDGSLVSGSNGNETFGSGNHIYSVYLDEDGNRCVAIPIQELPKLTGTPSSSNYNFKMEEYEASMRESITSPDNTVNFYSTGNAFNKNTYAIINDYTKPATIYTRRG